MLKMGLRVENGVDMMSTLQALVPAVWQAFSIILIGYASLKLNIICAAHRQALSLFVTKLSLPSLLFLGMAALDFGVVNWYFLLSVTIGKAFVFLVTLGVTILLNVGAPNVLGTAAIHAITTTQSNDFALGLPIIQAVFQKTHPEYASYLYLISPVQLLLLNPFAFVVLEMGKGQTEDAKGQPDDSTRPLLSDAHLSPDPPRSARASVAGQGESTGASAKVGLAIQSNFSKFFQVVHNVVCSPLVFTVPIGLAANFVFSHQLPILLSAPFQTLGAAFPSLALFILGMSMAEQTGSMDTATMLGPLMTSLILIAVKNLLLPVVIVLVLINFQVDTSLAMMGLIYGCLAIGPSVFFFAFEYNVCQKYIATTVVLGTFLSGPLVYVVTQLACMMMSEYGQIMLQVDEVAKTMAVIGGVGAMWTFVACFFPPGGRTDVFKDHLLLEHRLILCIALSLAATSIASLLCPYPMTGHAAFLRYVASFGGNVAAHVFAAVIAVIEVLCTLIGPQHVSPSMLPIIAASWTMTAVIVALPPLLSPLQPCTSDLLACWYPYGNSQYAVSASLKLVLAVVIVSCITIILRAQMAGLRAQGVNAHWNDLRLASGWRASAAEPEPSRPPSPLGSVIGPEWATAKPDLQPGLFGCYLPPLYVDVTPVTWVAPSEHDVEEGVMSSEVQEDGPSLVQVKEVEGNEKSPIKPPGIPPAPMRSAHPRSIPRSLFPGSVPRGPPFGSYTGATSFGTSPTRVVYREGLVGSLGLDWDAELDHLRHRQLSYSDDVAPGDASRRPRQWRFSGEDRPPQGQRPSVSGGSQQHVQRSGNSVVEGTVSCRNSVLIQRRPSGCVLTSETVVRWTQQTDVNEQNCILLYCLYCLISILVALSLTLLPLLHSGATPDRPLSGLLLLLNTVLSYGEGAVLFFAFGIQPGVVRPLIALRDRWDSYRKFYPGAPRWPGRTDFYPNQCEEEDVRYNRNDSMFSMRGEVFYHGGDLSQPYGEAQVR